MLFRSFQGVGKGPTSLFLTFMRSLVFAAVFAYLLAIPLGMGERGVWWGLVAGEIAGGLLAYVWARAYLARLDLRIGEDPALHGECDTA